MNIISVDNNDNLVFGAPLKVGEFEINPSNGGVLENGVPYQGTPGGGGGGGGSTDVPIGAKDYLTVRRVLTNDHQIGSANLSIGILMSLVANKTKLFITVGPPERVLPGPGAFIEPQVFVIYMVGLPDPGNPPFRPIFYSNMYSSGSVIAPFTTTSTATFRIYTVTVNYPDSIFGVVDSWMQPADCGLFMELLPL